MVQAKYQYGTSPRKINTDYNNKNKKKSQYRELKIVKDVPRQQIHLSKEQLKKRIKMTVTLAGIFVLLLTISCRNSQIDKKFNTIQNQKKELSTIQKENEQLKVSIENSLNLNNIEKIAKEELGMQKLTSKQTIYVALPKKDYVESASEKIVIDQEKTWFKKIYEKIFNI